MRWVRLNVEAVLKQLLKQEDTNGDQQITIDDQGPKAFSLSVDGQTIPITGASHLANFLQELVLARESAGPQADIDLEQIFLDPVNRLSQMIRNRYWTGLIRHVDIESLPVIMADSKADPDAAAFLYIPSTDQQSIAYYRSRKSDLMAAGITMVELPEIITPQYVQSIVDSPGILGLKLRRETSGEINGVPFVVPGGRFNEMYGWDSYFIGLGLIADGLTDLARDMVDNQVYQIEHYGQILNANRSYYLTRSQPPFLTSFAHAVYTSVPALRASKKWLSNALLAAMNEYETVWMNADRLCDNGLSRYYGSGIGMPIETEAGHFDSIIRPYARAANMDLELYRQKIRNREIVEPALDEYFLHDRSLRESGHDTTWRLDNISAHLTPVDLNSLLYKYETDIAWIIDEEFDGLFPGVDDQPIKSEVWLKRASDRRERVNEFLWDSERGLYADYDFFEKRPRVYHNATLFYPLWAGLCSRQQAVNLVKNGLALLEAPGGILASTEAARGELGPERPQRQWDYPFGWAPHQIMTWQGLLRYGYEMEAHRLIYRWLHMVSGVAADYNGIVVEKYNVIECNHKADVEYGNVGANVKDIPREGFGWTNASFQLGVSLLPERYRKLLEQRVLPADVFGEPK